MFLPSARAVVSCAKVRKQRLLVLLSNASVALYSDDLGATWNVSGPMNSEGTVWQDAAYSANGKLLAIASPPVGSSSSVGSMSLNGGRTWSSNVYLPDVAQNVCSPAPDVFLFPTYSMGMYRSVGGFSWSRTSGPNSIFAVPIPGTSIVVANNAVSTDAGLTWTAVMNSSLSNNAAGAASPNGTVIIPGDSYYISTDFGVTWTARSPSGSSLSYSGMGPLGCAVWLSGSKFAFSGAQGWQSGTSRVLKYNAGGWTSLDLPYGYEIRPICVAGGRLFGIGRGTDQLLVSDDEGQTWTEVSSLSSFRSSSGVGGSLSRLVTVPVL